MEQKELTKILKSHKLWISDHTKGSRADLTGADLTGADLTGADLTRANLTRANLTRANLTWADLTWADLAGADLTGANLAGANLYGVNLAKADLTRANLAGASLTRANLAEANLTRANLTEANLTRANLTGANLTGAYLTWADLTRADLAGANYNPSLILHQVSWGIVSNELCIELMKYDARNSPNPKAFNNWKEGGSCPFDYSNTFGVERSVKFREDRSLWNSNLLKKRVLSPLELVKRLFEEKSIKYKWE